MDSTTHHHPIARLGNGGKTFLFLDFSHLIRPDQPISAAADLRSCASGSPACTAGRDRSRASLPVRRKVSVTVTVTRLSTPGQGPASVSCEIFIAAHRACSTLHAPAPIPVPVRQRRASIASVERVAWLIDSRVQSGMYVSFLSRRLSAHPSSPGPGHSTQISILAPQQHLPPVGLGHPALSSVPPIPNTSLAGRLAGWLPVPSSALGGLPAAARWRLLPPHGCHLASHGFALASVAVWSPAPDHPRTMAMANAHLSSTSQKPPLPPLPTAHCFACAPATRLLHRDKPLPCHCTPFFYRIPAHYGAGFALLMVADVAQRK